ncbi:MAG: acetate kinase [Clostridia bacterium]|nr:acetate kinase [Clostridia bacterium]
MKILVVNAGSSSLKYQLFDMSNGSVMAKGICEKIGINATSGSITHKRPNAEPFSADIPIPDHNTAIKLVLEKLTDKELGVISDVSEIAAVGHRFVHGGKLKESNILNEEILAYIESIVPINPLHGPASLKGVYACIKAMPNVPQVGVYDSAFFAQMPEAAYTYAIPYEWTEKYGIRRYGFHGTSHRYVSQEAAKYIGKPIEDLKIITCHLGSGSSVSAIKNGIAVDTSMGFTPQDGLAMGTRCGPLDPSIVTFLINKGFTADELDTALTKKSGLIGVSGVSSDARDVWAAVEQGNERAKLAMDLVVHHTKKLVGSYIAEMNGVDVIVITAGLGENDCRVRNMIFTNMEYLGIKINEELNMNAPRGTTVELTAEGSKVRVLILPTDEELMIAKDTQRLANEFYAK